MALTLPSLMERQGEIWSGILPIGQWQRNFKLLFTLHVTTITHFLLFIHMYELWIRLTRQNPKPTYNNPLPGGKML